LARLTSPPPAPILKGRAGQDAGKVPKNGVGPLCGKKGVVGAIVEKDEDMAQSSSGLPPWPGAHGKKPEERAFAVDT